MSLHKITRYKELTEIVSAFAAEDSTLLGLVIVGAPGTGKTTLRRALKDAHIMESVTTAYGLYKEVYEHSGSPIIVLDDVDTIWKDPRGLNILKCLLQTDRVKTLQWNTSQPDRDQIPRKFQTSARILILANTIKGAGKNFKAVIDRVIGYRFAPTAQEVHWEVKKWPAGVVEPAVMNYIRHYLKFIHYPSFRDYIKATQLHRANLPFHEMLLKRWAVDPKLAYVYSLIAQAWKGDEHLRRANNRAMFFEMSKYGTRSTYYEYQAQLLEILGWEKLKFPKLENGRIPGLADAVPAIPPELITGIPAVKSESPTVSQLPETTPVVSAMKAIGSESPTFSQSPAMTPVVSAMEPKSESPMKSKMRDFPIHLPKQGITSDHISALTAQQLLDELRTFRAATFKRFHLKKKEALALPQDNQVSLLWEIARDVLAGPDSQPN